MSELKPCPFCGGEAAAKHNSAWGVYCDCGANTAMIYGTEQAAIDAWNRRADGWICIYDMIPADGQIVIGATVDGDVNTCLINSHGVWFWNDGFTEIYGAHADIVWWMPLPEPPRIEE